MSRSSRCRTRSNDAKDRDPRTPPMQSTKSPGCSTLCAQAACRSRSTTSRPLRSWPSADERESNSVSKASSSVRSISWNRRAIPTVCARSCRSFVLGNSKSGGSAVGCTRRTARGSGLSRPDARWILDPVVWRSSRIRPQRPNFPTAQPPPGRRPVCMIRTAGSRTPALTSRRCSAFVPPISPATNFIGVVHPDDADDFRTALRHALRDDATVATIRARDSAGVWRTLHVTMRLGGERDERLIFSLAPAPSASEGPTSGRVAELAAHLRQIADEIEGARLASPVGIRPALSGLPKLEDLSTRQWDIITRLLRGERVPTIAKGLCLSASTIRNHLSTIYRKVGVNSQVELVEVLHSALGQSRQ